MFKTVVTPFRGSVAAAGEEVEDRTALLILDQQMRDAAAAVERSKRTPLQRLGELHLRVLRSLLLPRRDRHLLPADRPLDEGLSHMGVVMLIQTCITLTKTVRDNHESSRLVNRIEDAKAERLLMEVSKAA